MKEFRVERCAEPLHLGNLLGQTISWVRISDHTRATHVGMVVNVRSPL
ncbi:hypothetical protein MnTg02_02631 [bacterium MnTg02]|nr:hypothetical protein MnTg02_02631 [bacterium MnTg02]